MTSDRGHKGPHFHDMFAKVASSAIPGYNIQGVANVSTEQVFKSGTKPLAALAATTAKGQQSVHLPADVHSNKNKRASVHS